LQEGAACSLVPENLNHTGVGQVFRAMY
jgi:hypothetical protein